MALKGLRGWISQGEEQQRNVVFLHISLGMYGRVFAECDWRSEDGRNPFSVDFKLGPAWSSSGPCLKLDNSGTKGIDNGKPYLDESDESSNEHSSGDDSEEVDTLEVESEED